MQIMDNVSSSKAALEVSDFVQSTRLDPTRLIKEVFPLIIHPFIFYTRFIQFRDVGREAGSITGSITGSHSLLGTIGLWEEARAPGENTPHRNAPAGN